MSRALFGRVRMTGGGSARTGPEGQFRWLGTEAPFEPGGGPGPGPLPTSPARGAALPHRCEPLAPAGKQQLFYGGGS